MKIVCLINQANERKKVLKPTRPRRAARWHASNNNYLLERKILQNHEIKKFSKSIEIMLFWPKVTFPILRCIFNDSDFTLIFFQATIAETSRKMFCQLSLARFADLSHEICLIFYSSIFYFIFATCFSLALKCLFQMQIWMIKVISMEEIFWWSTCLLFNLTIRV